MVWCEFGADHKCTGKAWEIRTWNVWEDEGKEWQVNCTPCQGHF